MRTASSRILALTAVVLLTGIAAADVYTCDSQLAHQPASGGAVEDPELSPGCSLLREQGGLLATISTRFNHGAAWAEKQLSRGGAVLAEALLRNHSAALLGIGTQTARRSAVGVAAVAQQVYDQALESVTWTVMRALEKSGVPVDLDGDCVADSVSSAKAVVGSALHQLFVAVWLMSIVLCFVFRGLREMMIWICFSLAAYMFGVLKVLRFLWVGGNFVGQHPLTSLVFVLGAMIAWEQTKARLKAQLSLFIDYVTSLVLPRWMQHSTKQPGELITKADDLRFDEVLSAIRILSSQVDSLNHRLAQNQLALSTTSKREVAASSC